VSWSLVGFFLLDVVDHLQLLWEEECSNEVGVRRPEGDVALVDVHHVGRRVEAILLGGEIVGKR
jgi:hypothetical protein